MKGRIRSNHMPTNKFEFKVVGLIALTAVTISGIEEEINTIELPDHTIASSGERTPIEFEMEIPSHHLPEIAAMEIWYKEGQDPILPTYKKPCTLTLLALDGRAKKSYTIVGCFVRGRNLPDLDMQADGDMATNTYMMAADELQPI